MKLWMVLTISGMWVAANLVCYLLMSKKERASYSGWMIFFSSGFLISSLGLLLYLHKF